MRDGGSEGWPTCRPETCSRTGVLELGRCWGSRSWGARTGTSGTRSCSPCRSRTSASSRFSSCAAPGRCGATTPWSVRCGWPESGPKSRRRLRHRQPGRLLRPPRSPSPRSPGGGSVRRKSLCLCTPLCAVNLSLGEQPSDQLNFLLSRASDRPINGAQQRPHRSGETACWRGPPEGPLLSPSIHLSRLRPLHSTTPLILSTFHHLFVTASWHTVIKISFMSLTVR